MSTVVLPLAALPSAALGPLDRTLGRVTMYRLTALLLAALAVISLVLSLTGDLDFDAGALLASAAVAVGVSYVTNRLVAPLLRVRPHAESALITGLLLFFIFLPSTVGGDLLDLAVAAVAATVSKYLVAFRGRHLLNPAAAGAAFVGVLQLNASGWWISSQAMLPFVLVAGLLVLYRTRRLPLAVTFVVVAAITLYRLTDGGQGFGDAFQTTFTSYPILFFVAFMLSEPLTLPPRRFQQLGVAVLVAVLFSIPMHVGDVYMTPELALVLGNVAAFALARRTGVRLRFVERRELGPSTAEYAFAPVRPVGFSPGQYAELALPHGSADRRGVRRAFTIASAPAARGAAGEVAFGVREVPDGSSFKRTLGALEPGDVVGATTVAGDFLLPRDREQPLLLVAGGIGVTPFVSQIRHELGTGEAARDVVLVYGLGPAEGMPYREELARSGVRVVVVSPAAPAGLPAGWSHVAAERLTEDVLRDAVPDAAGRRAYVSGPPAMVDAVRGALRRLGVRRVRTDHFAGY